MKNRMEKAGALLNLVVLFTATCLLLTGCGSGGSGYDATHHSDAILVATDANWETEVLGSQKPVLVNFWATWCGPCLRMAPTVDELAEDYEGRAVVAKLDVDKNPAISAKLGITAIPTFIVFHQGKELMRYEGMTSYKGLESMINKPLESVAAGDAAEGTHAETGALGTAASTDAH